MKKLVKPILALCLLPTALCAVSACSISNCHTKYYDKQGNVVHEATYGANQKITAFPYVAPQIYGFDLKGWGVSATDESVLSLPCTISSTSLYAKYVVSDSWFTASGYNQSFTGDDLYWRVQPNNLSSYQILLTNLTGNEGFSYIQVLAEMPGSFVVKQIKLLDEYANEIPDNNPAADIWEAKDPLATKKVGKFVLSIEYQSSGVFYVDVR